MTCAKLFFNCHNFFPARNQVEKAGGISLSKTGFRVSPRSYDRHTLHHSRLHRHPELRPVYSFPDIVSDDCFNYRSLESHGRHHEE